MRRKEYAASIGLANSGRGRMSLEAHKAILDAEANGMTFSDSPRVTVKTGSDGNVETVVEEFNPHATTPDPVWSTDNWHVFIDGKRKPVGKATVCVTCKVSLPWHRCSTPSVLAPDCEIRPVYNNGA